MEQKSEKLEMISWHQIIQVKTNLQLCIVVFLPTNQYPDFNFLINLLTPEDFHVFEWFFTFTRPIEFRDSIFKVTIESAAVLKHQRLEFTGNVIVTLSFCFVELE